MDGKRYGKWEILIMQSTKFMENKMKNNSIEYMLAGDYYIPDLKLPNEERPLESTVGCTVIISKRITLCGLTISFWKVSFGLIWLI